MREAARYPDRGNTVRASTAHERARRVALDVLETHLPPDTLVAVNLSLYPRQDIPRLFRIPDLLMALGAGAEDPVLGEPRLSYQMWDEVGPPDLVMEFASTKTVARDAIGKKEDYAGFGIREYVQFDPMGRLLRPNLQVWWLESDCEPRTPGCAGTTRPRENSPCKPCYTATDIGAGRVISNSSGLPYSGEKTGHTTLCRVGRLEVAVGNDEGLDRCANWCSYC